MATAPDVEPYRHVILKWMPKAQIRPLHGPGRFDGVLAWKTPGHAIRYLIEEKRHLPHQDIGVVVQRLNRQRAALPRGERDGRILLLAPHVRAEQAAVLEGAGIDYLDLAGNAHLQPPGLFVHIEGRRAPKAAARAIRRPQTAWVKTIMALLIKPELVRAPYRALAQEADVALGTLPASMNDLKARGLLLDTGAGRTLTDREALVALWVQAYVDVLRPKLGECRLQIRATGKDEIWKRFQTVLGKRRQPWALTGSDAAGRRAHYFRARETEIYAPVRALEDRETQKALVAQPAAHEGNVLVIEPPGPLAMPAVHATGVPIAPNLLAYAELRYRGTQQALEAAELLLPKVLADAAD